ncbi:enoyl-CoA hydratase/isomerase family protein [Mycolicibacterium gilvum]|uniref:Enoyl-CoA hydratase/isomerase n=1 Tax=Mycolicibacterium gilvum TaxID=1804 RepID=A0A378SK21_9MYCO|nr:enoyl-CoA hydratase/isomerase family protein [Mycolicibacterium gilvum]MCV7054323.1 enoyl-CoA hydratase/isomerase family protein [Mycolicibacterium gilvum]STZ42725.1 enoyl-CoA hydratase/isomerase [Mycolicibacterium gilvum]
MLTITTASRVRTITFDRAEAMNAFNEALYHATSDALRDAADDGDVAVVLLTGSGRAFCAGTDLQEMLDRDPTVPFTEGAHGFQRLMGTLIDFPKPLVCAVNGIGVGLGATVLAFADLVFMSTGARLRCPFTSLGISPEAASTYLLPELVGRQNAAWILMSSEWITAEEALAMGLVWKVCEPDDLLPVAVGYAERLAAQPIESLVAVKAAMSAPHVDNIRAALARESALLDELVGGPANTRALADFTAARTAKAR